jgi:uncharacterized membrane protein YkvA (DUF1232 family)
VYNVLTQESLEHGMTDKKDIMIPSQGGMIRDFVLRIKLILRLIGDRRVNPWLKIIPVAGVLYLLSPLDLIPDIALPVIGELDDAAVLWLTNYLFIELCPPQIVQEHVRLLTAGSSTSDSEDVIDAESVEIKDNTK